MRFWDSSAVVPLLVSEDATAATIDLLRADPVQLVWWATDVECTSAVARLEREAELETSQTDLAFERLRWLREAWHEIQATESLRVIARRVLRTHALRAADALQLAAAIVASDGVPGSLDTVTLDDGLAIAAGREGLTVIRPVS